MNIKCFNCGHIYVGNFCPNCGAPVASPAPISKKRNLSTGAIIAITLSSIIAFLIFVWILFYILANLTADTPTTNSSIKQPDREITVTSDPGIDKVEELTISVGDTIQVDGMEIEIRKIEFSYDVLPDDTSSFYTHYEADKGAVYIHIDTEVKNLSKQNLKCEDILSVKANYNNGYTYNSQVIPEDSSTGFTYAIITSIDPLKSLGIRFIISCPEEVEESDNPLYLIFQLNESKDNYRYTIR